MLDRIDQDQGPRELKKSVRARSPKYAPKIQIFAFYCIFTLQFSKVSEGPGPHGPHAHEAPVNILQKKIEHKNLKNISAKFGKIIF